MDVYSGKEDARVTFIGSQAFSIFHGKASRIESGETAELQLNSAGYYWIAQMPFLVLPSICFAG